VFNLSLSLSIVSIQLNVGRKTMVQEPNRRVRWCSAVNRATNAAGGLQNLHTQWAIKLEELREELDNICAERSRLSQEFNDAISDLKDLQSEYESWRENLPDFISESIINEKLWDVLNISFMYLNIGELEKFVLEQAMDDLPDDAIDAIEDHLLEKALDTLYEAREVDLPKGYGRD
jgi:predicted nuclease with TOPRIM domain